MGCSDRLNDTCYFDVVGEAQEAVAGFHNCQSVTCSLDVVYEAQNAVVGSISEHL